MSVIKWAGGKSRLLPIIQSLMGDTVNFRYIDLFCGSIHIPYTLGLKNVVLNDINTSLITMYKTIQKHSTSLLDELEVLNEDRYNNREWYEKYREEYNSTKNLSTDTVRLSALFIYLNKRCFNGLYRENSKGLFNVPFRKYNTDIYDKDTILNLSKYLNENNVILTSKQYKDFSLDFFRPGDLVYIDPPYDGTFSQYWSTPFGKQEQRELRDFCRVLDNRGIRFIQSNAPTEEIRELYKNFYMFSFYIGRQMRDAKSYKSEGYKPDNEILIWNYEKLVLN